MSWRFGNRLFDQQVLSAFQEESANFVMGYGGGADGCGVDQAGEFFQRAGGIRAVFPGHVPSDVLILVVYGREGATLELRIDARMIDAHVAYADNAGAKNAHSETPNKVMPASSAAVQTAGLSSRRVEFASQATILIFASPGDSDGRFPENWNIEAHVLPRLTHLDHYRILAGEIAAAADAFIGPLESFNGEDGSRFNDHGLAYIKLANFLGDLETKPNFIHVARLDVRTCDIAGTREMIVQEGRRVQDLQPALAS